MSAPTPVITTLRVSLHGAGDSPLFGESATLVEVEDEGDGPYLRIRQPTRATIDPDPHGLGGITLTGEELQLLVESARLLGVIK